MATKARTNDNKAINAWIRGQAGRGEAPPPTPVTDPNAPAPTPRGNAGSGTGAPPSSPPPTMNEMIRRAAGRNF